MISFPLPTFLTLVNSKVFAFMSYIATNINVHLENLELKNGEEIPREILEKLKVCCCIIIIFFFFFFEKKSKIKINFLFFFFKYRNSNSTFAISKIPPTESPLKDERLRQLSQKERAAMTQSSLQGLFVFLIFFRYIITIFYLFFVSTTNIFFLQLLFAFKAV